MNQKTELAGLPRTQKEELLRLLLQRRSELQSSRISYGEKALWLLHSKDPYNFAYHLHGAWDIAKPVSVERLMSAAKRLYSMHESLRATYLEEDGEIQRKIAPAGEPDFSVHYLDVWNDEAKACFSSHLREPFSLNEGPLIRFRLYVPQGSTVRLLISMHHIITDAWSLTIMLRHFFALYLEGLPDVEIFSLPPGKDQAGYPAFVKWQEQYLASNRAERDRIYWENEFSAPLPFPPLLHQCPDEDDREKSSNHFRFSESLSADVVSLSRSGGVTVNMFLLAAFTAMLHCCSGRKEVVVGTFTTGRNDPSFENTLGYFVNTLALRLSVDESMSFIDLLDAVKYKLLSSMEHQDYPFPLVVQGMQKREDSLDAVSLIQTAFVMERAQDRSLQSPLFTGGENDEIQWGALRMNPVPLPVLGTPFEFTLMMEETECFIGGTVAYQPDRYTSSFVQSWISSFIRFVEQIVSHPSEKLEDVWEQQEQANGFSTQAGKPDEHICLHHLLEYQAHCRPQHTALASPSGSLTYSELDQHVNQLANYLRKMGVQRGDFVGASLGRSPDMVIAAFATLKVGAAYVPIDPGYPMQRKSYMANHMGIAFVITTSDMEELDGTNIQHVCLDRLAEEIAAENMVFSGEPAINDDLAYVIFTSGSTGEPKAVLVEHRGIWNMAQAQRQHFGLQESSRIMQFASPSFDAWVFEVVMAFRSGGSLRIPSADALLPGPEMLLWMEKEGISHIVMPPSVLNLLPYRELESLEVIISAGEACTSELVRRWAPGRRFYNAYGPSEATVWATVKECFSHEPLISIGEPISNVDLHILNERMEQLPPGEFGELYISGIGIARGYHNDSRRTAEKFGWYVEIDSRAADNNGETMLRRQRIYQTGDLVKQQADGGLVFVGRKDDQIKIHGLRVNLGEIEHHLAACEGVLGSTVLAVPDFHSSDSRLVAFILLRDPNASDEERIRRALEHWLPPSLVPSRFIMLKQLPLTPNGKVDRKALLALIDDWDGRSNLPSYSGLSLTEDLLLGIWRDLLQRPDIACTDSFFEAGGHSLLAVRLSSRIRSVFGVNIPVNRIFERPILQEMATEIEALTTCGLMEDADRIEIVKPEDKIRLPLTNVQQKIWFMQALDEGGNAYLMPGVLSFRGMLDVPALELAINALIGRHDSLRMHISGRENGIPYISVGEPQEYPLKINTCAEEEADQNIQAECKIPIKLTDERLFRYRLWKAGERYYLTLVVHHFIMDGWSMSLLLNELGELYDAYVERREARLFPLALGYADYAVWERKRKDSERYRRQLSYWEGIFKDSIPSTELPADFPRQPALTYPGNSVKLLLPLELREGLHRLTRCNGCTLFMTLLAIFDVLLYRLSGQSDIVVGAPAAGRTIKPLEPIVGLFVNTLLLRNRITQEMSFTDLLQSVRETAIGAFAHQDVSLEEWVEEVNPNRDTGLSSLFRVMFNMLNMPPIHLRMKGVEAEIIELKDYASKYELTFYAQEVDEGIMIEAVYAANLFTQERVSEMLAQYERLCVQVLAEPEGEIKHFSLLTPESAGRLPDLGRPLLQGSTECLPVHILFSSVAAQYSDKGAIVNPDGTGLTYGQTDDQSNWLAKRLMSKINWERPVIAILGERSASLVVSILAVQKAGGIFMLLDPRDPLERSIAMLHAASAKGLLIARGKRDFSTDKTMALAREVQFVLEYGQEQGDKAENNEFSPIFPLSTDPAYILFTSGTTALPKAVLCSHEPLARFVTWYLNTFQVNSGDRFSMFSGIGHDPLLRDIFVPLCAGAAICIPDERYMVFPDYVNEWMRSNRISVTHLTPAMAMVIAGGSRRTAELIQQTNWRYAFFSGDTLLASHVDGIRRIAPNVRCFNGYGATETPQLMSIFQVGEDGNDRIAIGSGREGVELLIMGPEGEMRGIGEAGEIVVRSPYLALGYLNDQRDEENPFCLNPAALLPGDRLYKTGDMGRYNPDGTIEFLGRRAGIVKIRGHRVQLAEIRSAIMDFPVISNCAMVWEQERLIAYVVPAEQPFTPAKLQVFLRDKLPDYMLPYSYDEVERIPLTPNGKIDYVLLKETAARTAYAPRLEKRTPETKLQQEISVIWKRLLGKKDVGIMDHFFEIGGHSLLLIQVHQQLESLLDRAIPIVALFRYPTIADLAAFLEDTPTTSGIAAAITETTVEQRRDKRFSAIKAQKAKRKGTTEL